MKAFDALKTLQQELKVPKARKALDKHGNIMFRYRNLEDILDAAKKVIKEKKIPAIILMDDELIFHGDSTYIKSTITLQTDEDSISCSAVGKEISKKRQFTDEAMLSGICSSYTRKYGSNGLFALNDVPDSDDLAGETEELKTLDDLQVQKIQKLIEEVNPDMNKFQAYIDSLTGKKDSMLKDVEQKHFKTIVALLEKKKNENPSS